MKQWMKRGMMAVAAVVVMAGIVPAMARAATDNAPIMQMVKANGVDFAYSVQGVGKPIVLLHGGGLTSAMWSKQVEALAAEHKVYALDTRGHGKSNNPSHEFNYRLLADDVVAFCKALNIKKPILMGYSDGGIVALTVGIFHPDFASALVLGGAVAPSDQADIDHYFSGMRLYYAPVEKRTALTDFDLDAMYAASPSSWDYTATMHAKPGQPNYWRTLMKDVWLTWNNPQSYAYTAAQLASVTVPTLVILGDSDEFFNPEKAARFARLLPNAELAVIPKAGHNVFRAKSELFNSLVLDFLGRH